MELSFENTLILVSLGTSTAVLFGVIITLVVMLFRDRSRHQAAIGDLLNRLMAENLTELAQTKQSLETSNGDEIKKMKVENELAARAEQILNDKQSKDVYPVT